MINLLPKSYKGEIRAARTNVILIRYTIITFMAFAFLVLILIGSTLLLETTKQSSVTLIEANAAKAAEYSETSNQISSLTESLSTARAVLDNQISYSKVLQAISAAMPEGTILNEVTLTDASFDGTTPTTFTVYAKTNDAAVNVGQVFLSTPGFTDAKIESISEAGTITGYPVNATLTVTLNRSLGQ